MLIITLLSASELQTVGNAYLLLEFVKRQNSWKIDFIKLKMLLLNIQNRHGSDNVNKQYTNPYDHLINCHSSKEPTITAKATNTAANVNIEVL